MIVFYVEFLITCTIDTVTHDTTGNNAQDCYDHIATLDAMEMGGSPR